MGNTVFDIMESLKKQQIEQAKKDFPEFKENNPNFKRQLRSEKSKNSPEGDIGGCAGDPEEVKDASEPKQPEEPADEEMETFDKYELAKPVDILKTFGQDWIDSVEACKTWNNKVEKLEVLIQALDVPKLKEGNYLDLTELLKKLLKDTNAVVI